ncbi:MAG: GatB/YqeY domain-containing protein [Cyclobacteriaceae bacterium]|nr:GatB/YqeY domain-containing protein [Cyclobacteriaceae bacterium]
MSLKERINEDIKKAMLAKKKEELTALRSIKSAILLAETEKGAQSELSQDVEMKLLMKAAKQRKESGELFAKEGRNDLAEKEFFEHEIISKYLPQQMNEDELRETLKEIIQSVSATGPSDMGKVMGLATKQLAGKADGKAISSVVRELLQG